MSLRIATAEDFDLVFSMAKKFVESTDYNEHADDEAIKRLITEFLNSDNTDKIILLYGFEGMIAGLAFPFIYGKDKMVTELAWWVEPESRGNETGAKLLEAFEYWAREVVKAKLVTMISLDDKVGKFYEKNGYALQERTYMKVL